MEPFPFKQAIKEHLVLREQNRVLEAEMPLDRYRSEESTPNHALFKSEAEAVSEETVEVGQDASPVMQADTGPSSSDELWVRSPTFEWGD